MALVEGTILVTPTKWWMAGVLKTNRSGSKGLEFETFNCGAFAIVGTGFLLLIGTES
jgi:hypothetical protein